MERPNNTLSNLLATTSPTEEKSFYCPKCGSHMSFLLPYSVVPTFSPDALERVNQYFTGFYRNWISAIAGFLNRVNIGVKDRDPIVDSLLGEEHAEALLKLVVPRDEYDDDSIKTLQGRGVLQAGPISDDYNQLRAALDARALGRRIQDCIRPVGELNGDQATDPILAEGMKSLIECVLLQLEAGDLFAVVTDVVLSQREVEEWVEATKRESYVPTDSAPEEFCLETFVDKLGGVCVSNESLHYDYLWKYMKRLAKEVKTKEAWMSFSDAAGDIVELHESETNTGSDADERQWRAVRNRFERGCLLVALLTMHETPKGRDMLDKYFPSRFGDRGSNQYQLPKLATLTYEQMFDFLLAAEVVRYNWVGLQTAYSGIIASLKRTLKETKAPKSPPGQQSPKEPKAAKPETPPDGTKAYQVFVNGLADESFRKLVESCFGFACMGPGAAALKFSNATDQGNGEEPDNVIRDPFCGWYPKSYSTYSVVLLGTPGSGKSAAFQSGSATAPWAFKGIKDYSFVFDDSRTNNQVTRLRDLFSRGVKPPRTSRNDYYALTMTLARLKDKAIITPVQSDSADSLGFVFVDIPGERSTLELREDRVDPVVFNTLSHADIVVVFLDLSTDSEFAPRFLNGPHASDFKRFEKSRSDAQTDRGFNPNANAAQDEQRPPGDDENQIDEVDEDGGNEDEPETLANSDQFEFVKWIADKTSRLRKGERCPSFLVVVPKADLYLDQEKFVDTNKPVNRSKAQAAGGDDSKKHFFLQGFFGDLFDQAILSFPESEEGEAPEGGENEAESRITFADLFSTGGTTWDAPSDVVTKAKSEGKDTWAKTFEGQYSLIQNMSDKFLESSKQLGYVISNNPDRNPIASLWNEAFSTLRDQLNSYFGSPNVFFLPMSAQGFEDAEETTSKRSGMPFPQKLSEFLFVAPMTLAARNGKDQPGQGGGDS